MAARSLSVVLLRQRIFFKVPGHVQRCFQASGRDECLGYRDARPRVITEIDTNILSAFFSNESTSRRTEQQLVESGADCDQRAGVPGDSGPPDCLCDTHRPLSVRHSNRGRLSGRSPDMAYSGIGISLNILSGDANRRAGKPKRLLIDSLVGAHMSAISPSCD